MVRLIQNSHEDLPVCFQSGQRALQRVMCLEQGEREWFIGSVMPSEERENSRGGDEMFHKDGRELDEIRRTTCAGDIMIFRLTDHSYPSAHFWYVWIGTYSV